MKTVQLEYLEEFGKALDVLLKNNDVAKLYAKMLQGVYMTRLEQKN